MSSVNEDTAETGKGEKGKWPIAGGRCSPDDLHLIDRAALQLRKKRAHFVVEAALAAAREVLGEAA
jgi:uncharacterized protein (DUF1778 family)